jgi:hypothetical protein
MSAPKEILTMVARLSNRPRSSSRRSDSFRLRPQVSALEDRRLLSVLLQDDFNDNSLDPTKWQVTLPAIPGTPSVTEVNQHIELLDRGHLRTAQQFDPLLVGPLTITGTWTFDSSTIAIQQGDNFTVATRTHGEVDGPPYGGLLDGINFWATMGADSPSAMWITDNVTGRMLVYSAAIDLRNHDTFSFIIQDDGQNLAFTIQPPRGSVVTITAQSSTRSDVNYIDFHNRQRNNNPVPLRSYLDDVVVTGNPQLHIRSYSPTSPNGGFVNTLAGPTVTFNQPIDPNSFSSIVIDGPMGRIQATGLSLVGIGPTESISPSL